MRIAHGVACGQDLVRRPQLSHQRDEQHVYVSKGKHSTVSGVSSVAYLLELRLGNRLVNRGYIRVQFLGEVQVCGLQLAR